MPIRAEDMARQCWGDLQSPFGQAQINEAERWWEMAEALRAVLAPTKESDHGVL